MNTIAKDIYDGLLWKAETARRKRDELLPLLRFATDEVVQQIADHHEEYTSLREQIANSRPGSFYSEEFNQMVGQGSLI